MTMRRVILRLVPFLMICYFFALLDRVNIGFAALQMNKDLGLTPAMFGFAASLFFILYLLVEVPSNLALQKFGARRWIARIMITWGVVTACLAFVVGPYSLYAMRFILGAAEAGFFPGAILYLIYWLPSQYRARILATFTVSIPLATFLGSPLSVSLLQLDGTFGLHGWQWLFMLQGLPTILLGVACLFLLTDKPAQARWLTPEQREWLTGRMQAEASARKPVGHLSLWELVRNKYFLTMALVCSGASATGSVLSVWQPQLLKSFGLTNLQTGFVNAIPYASRPCSCFGGVTRTKRASAVGTRPSHSCWPPAVHRPGDDRNRNRANGHHGDVLPRGRLCLQGTVSRAVPSSLPASPRSPPTCTRPAAPCALAMQVSGLRFHEAPLPPSSKALANVWRPFVETSIDLFGHTRCLFESNFPVDKGMVGYCCLLWNAFKRLVAGYSEAERPALFAGTACDVYRLSRGAG